VREPEAQARAALRRGALGWLAVLALDLLAFWYIFANQESAAAYLPLSFTGGVGLLLLYQLVQYVRDASAPLVETEGTVLKKWSRADYIFFGQGYYIAVGRAIFRIPAEDYLFLDEGAYVKVVHFPRTLNVVSVHPSTAPPPPDA
jgi:hypothetical protein